MVLMLKIHTAIKRFLYIICLAVIPGSLFAQQGRFTMKDLSGFLDSKHHWLDITDHEGAIVPEKDQQDYAPENFREIADNILLYQQPNGGWPKNYDMMAVLTDQQKQVLALHKDSLRTTFDNGATHTQIGYLSRVYSVTGNDRYKEAVIRGMRFILQAQYANGGWPQFYPDRSGYRKYITFNDGAMIGVMTLLQAIVQGENDFSFIQGKLKEEITLSYKKGIDCILKCQIIEKGRKTIWCQQHDQISLEPAPARTFELASKATGESAGIIIFLMKINNPDPEVIDAVNSAVAWLKQAEIKGIRVQTVPAPKETYIFHEATNDRVVVEDSLAPPVWTRFYELETDRPLFANRDGKKVYQLSEVARERRTGYAWYGYWPAKIINTDYPGWLNSIKTGTNNE